MLNLDIKRVAKSLNPEKSISQKESMLKLANEVEKFTQTQMWGYNIIDILHSVRRAQAINSNIKEAGLKYITKYIDGEAPDRVYVDHNKIGSMYREKEEYWLNIENGKYKKVGVDSKIDDVCSRHSNVYIKTTGDDIIERYLTMTWKKLYWLTKNSIKDHSCWHHFFQQHMKEFQQWEPQHYGKC